MGANAGDVATQEDHEAGANLKNSKEMKDINLTKKLCSFVSFLFESQ
jgi:hypothetical protein